MQNQHDLLTPEKLGSLQDELEGVTESFVGMAPKEITETILDRIKALAESDILELALKEGDVAPDFCLPDTEGNLVSSVDLRASGPLVVMFFRGNWCPYCDTTLRMLRKYTPYFKARGATVIAISSQTPEASAKIVKEAGLNFPVLSDTNSELAQACNIAFVMDEVLRPIYDKFGVDLVQLNGDDSFILPIPATYVIQTDGRVSYSFLETDFTKRAEPIEVLNALPPLKVNKRRSLNEKMEFELSRLRERHSEKKLKSMFEEIESLKASGIEASALKVGDKAPDFKLYGRDGHVVDSKKLRKQGPVIVTFYHGQASPLCIMALDSMQKYLSKFEAKGASLVAITPAGSADDLHKATVTSGAKFPLLNDSKNDVSKQFGVAHDIVPPFAAGDDDDERPRTLPMAATYVIDQAGMVVYSFVDCDHTKRAEPTAVLKALPSEPPKYSRKFGPFSLLFGNRIAHRYSSHHYNNKAIRSQ